MSGWTRIGAVEWRHERTGSFVYLDGGAWFSYWRNCRKIVPDGFVIRDDAMRLIDHSVPWRSAA